MTKAKSRRNGSIWLSILFVGIGMVIAPIALARMQLTLINDGANPNFNTSAGTAEISTAAYFSAPSSIAWTTNWASSEQTIIWFQASSLASNPIIQCKMYIPTLPAWQLLTVQVDTYENGVWHTYLDVSYRPLIQNSWNDIIADARLFERYSGNGEHPDLASVQSVSFNWWNNNRPADWTTYIDDLEVLPATPIPTATPTPTPIPTATPISPTPTPTATVAPSAYPTPTFAPTLPPTTPPNTRTQLGVMVQVIGVGFACVGAAGFANFLGFSKIAKAARKFYNA